MRPHNTATSRKDTIMLCLTCAERGIDQPAVALCRSCNAGLCLVHLRETAAHFAASHMLDTCHHDTWTATEPPSGAQVRRAALAQA
jgi:predicted nucleic acid binding AN1-type Zn finger protein